MLMSFFERGQRLNDRGSLLVNGVWYSFVFVVRFWQHSDSYSVYCGYGIHLQF